MGDINEVLKTTPELNNYPSELWQQTYEFLRTEGFSTHKFAFIISQNPKLLITSQEKIFASINNWRAFQFGERDTISLLERFPELMNLQHTKDLTKKIDTIKDFVGGGSNMLKLLLNSPSVLGQSLPIINEKIDYLKNVMKVEAAEVYKSDVFSGDILNIKTRHIFLQRLGLFVVKKKKDPNEISKNPKLYQIMDTSEKRFATKVCHVTLEEFETFQELYKKEIENAQHQESSDEENYENNDDTVVAEDYSKF